MAEENLSHEEYWTEAMRVIKAMENGNNRNKIKRNFFKKELKLDNITKEMLQAGNLTCRATNNPELTPATTTLQLIKFGKGCRVAILLIVIKFAINLVICTFYFYKILL